MDIMDNMECYDIKRNLWSSLPATNKRHDMRPLVWIEDNNLLQIMSVSGNCIESIDIREGKKWDIKDQDVQGLFNTEFEGDINNATVSHLIGN